MFYNFDQRIYTEILLHIMMIINKPMIIDLNKIPIKCHPKQQQKQQIVVVDLHHRTCREFNSIDMQTYRATTENVIRITYSDIGDASYYIINIILMMMIMMMSG